MVTRVTSLPYEVEALLRKDLNKVGAQINAIITGSKPNYVLTDHSYLSPGLDKGSVVGLRDERGAYQHFVRLRTILEYIFEHDGMIKEKYRSLLHKMHAPAYMLTLLEKSIDVERGRAQGHV